ncbi:YicC family protein [Aquirufa nivalisilvae]|uniref:YicC/YloC family endoribonuclease n=1 Tax=Aquirufa nivalisilvae TaxID=2516557 RepID=UPI0022A99003|nr:YicC/YloC family endoribonuclease [Aquirufa nivalisilvae]MCZ2483739.1 YicC family protein [Aquirufa nivalisilvae]
MIYSMTGFGKAQKEIQDLQIKVEVKSLNSKFTDLFCRLPKSLSAREIEVRNYLTQQLERGKIELSLTMQKATETVSPSLLPEKQIEELFSELKRVAKQVGVESVNETDLYLHALSMPNTIQAEQTQETEEEVEALWQSIFEIIQEATQECKAFRLREGNVVEEKFKEYIASIKSGLDAVKEQDLIRMPNIRERMKKSLLDLGLNEDFDQNRFEQEVVYYIEKFDISEEKVRLATHLEYFLEVLKEGNGKKLNFMAQEIGREINTIGSKANDSNIQRLVVNMKDELEKIKEQTANVL